MILQHLLAKNHLTKAELLEYLDKNNYTFELKQLRHPYCEIVIKEYLIYSEDEEIISVLPNLK